MLLFLNGHHGNNKNMTVVFQMCQTIHPLNSMFVSGLQTEIFETVYFLIVHAFIISDLAQSVFVQFVQNF